MLAMEEQSSIKLPSLLSLPRNINYSELIDPKKIFINCEKKQHDLGTKITFPQEMILNLCAYGFSQVEISQQLNIARSTLYRILKGHVKNPSRLLFYKLFRFYWANYWMKRETERLTE